MKRQWIISAILILLVGVAMFAPIWFSGGILQASDANIGHVSTVQEGLPESYLGRWLDQLLLGVPSYMPFSTSSLLLQTMSAKNAVNISYFLFLFGASVVLMLKMARKKMAWHAMAIGAVAAFWVGSNCTLLYAGHHGKFGVLLFFMASLFFAGQIRNRISHALFYGASVGSMFMEQADIALFCALFSGSYLIFKLWREQGLRPLKWMRIIVPAMVIAFLFAAGPLLTGYKQNVKNTSQVQTQTEQKKWEYVTQWSFPPDELINFVAPGYMGWRTGEPEGPYWGRVGQSAGCEKPGPGYNAKGENTYLGLIPVAFAVFALFASRRSARRAEILFWGGAAVVALLLSFGKYTPLYSLFYQLPIVNSVRNPNKFLQVFQICIAILTVYGVSALWQSKEDDGVGTKSARTFFWVSVAALVVLTFGSLSLTIGQNGDIAQFIKDGWPKKDAPIIIENRVVALWYASLMTAIVAGVFALFSFSKCEKLLRFKNWIAIGLVLIVAADAVRLSKHYVKEMPRCYVEANALTDFLKKDLGQERVALLSPQGVYNVWVTYLFPYNGIPSFSFSQVPRMPTDYEQFMIATSRDPWRMWRFSGVKYLLGPSAIEQQIPKNLLKKVFAYNLLPAGENEFKVVALPQGVHAVFELSNPISRYELIKDVGPVPDKAALALIGNSNKPLLGHQRAEGAVNVLQYRSGKVDLEVQAQQPCMLRVAERWDADWKATVDGEPVEIQRIDFLCQGISLPVGTHQITLVYAPSRLFFYMQLVGLIIVLGALMAQKILSRHEEA